MIEASGLTHKSGGEILSISAVGHETYKGVADWFYLGAVKWPSGKVDAERQIYPWQLCFDHDDAGARAEFDAVSKALNDYLNDTGEWLEKPQHKRDGRIVHWKPKAPNGTRAIAKVQS
jgi:hypothetical protein